MSTPERLLVNFLYGSSTTRATYEESLRDHFSAPGAALGGDTAAISSIDGVHLGHLPDR